MTDITIETGADDAAPEPGSDLVIAAAIETGAALSDAERAAEDAERSAREAEDARIASDAAAIEARNVTEGVLAGIADNLARIEERLDRLEREPEPEPPIQQPEDAPQPDLPADNHEEVITVRERKFRKL